MSTDVHSHLEELAPELVERLDDTCDRFEAEWKAGRCPRIKDHLSDAAETERATWLRELLALELDWRRRRGERPTPWEYLNEFPKDHATIHTAFVDARTAAPRQVAPVEDIERALDAIGGACKERGRNEARILGVHLEGPYINSGKLGAQIRANL